MHTQFVPYPVNLDLAGRAVLVVGGGPVAARKVEALLAAGACVTVVAPGAVTEISSREELCWERRRYRSGEAGRYRLAVTATDDAGVNAQVARDGEAANIFVNSADDPPNCSFTLPSVARRGDVQVAVSTNGRSPALARWLRARIEGEIADGYEALIDLLAETRAEARAEFGTSEIPGWQAALDDSLLDLLRQGDVASARCRLRGHLGLAPSARRAPSDEDPSLAHGQCEAAASDAGLGQSAPDKGLNSAAAPQAAASQASLKYEVTPR